MKRILLLIGLIITALTIQCADLNQAMVKAGLVDVATVNRDILVELMYGKTDNFTGVRLYDTLTKAYLRPEAAAALDKAQKALSAKHPGYRLKVYDASRPMSVQRKMYNVVRGGAKARYVSNPRNGGGLHNYGMAVDITIVDEKGDELPMGTKVDHLGREANIDREAQLVRNGVITATERANRKLLREVMAAGGFRPLKSEWWHFNLCTRAYAKSHLKLLDF